MSAYQQHQGWVWILLIMGQVLILKALLYIWSTVWSFTWEKITAAKTFSHKMPSPRRGGDVPLLRHKKMCDWNWVLVLEQWSIWMGIISALKVYQWVSLYSKKYNLVKCENLYILKYNFHYCTLISIETVKLASSQHRFYFDVHKVCGKLGQGKTALGGW